MRCLNFSDNSLLCFEMIMDLINGYENNRNIAEKDIIIFIS